MGDKLGADELLWRQYNLLSELYKFYIEMLGKSILLIYGITGGIVAYTFSNANNPVIKWSLMLPLLFCMSFGFICLRGVRQARELQQEIKAIRDKLHIGLAPHIDILVYALFGAGIMYVLVAAAIFIVFFLV
jgi:hypothetical protein